MLLAESLSDEEDYSSDDNGCGEDECQLLRIYDEDTTLCVKLSMMISHRSNIFSWHDMWKHKN